MKLERVKDFVIWDRYYLKVDKDDKVDNLRMLKYSAFEYDILVDVNGQSKYMQMHTNTVDIKKSIEDLYYCLELKAKSILTLLLDYLFDDLKMTNYEIDITLTKEESNIFCAIERNGSSLLTPEQVEQHYNSMLGYNTLGGFCEKHPLSDVLEQHRLYNLKTRAKSFSLLPFDGRGIN